MSAVIERSRSVSGREAITRKRAYQRSYRVAFQAGIRQKHHIETMDRRDAIGQDHRARVGLWARSPLYVPGFAI